MARALTEHRTSIDIRRWAREGMLTLGYRGSWAWIRNGEVDSAIRMRAEADRVVLEYEARNGGNQWTNQKYPIRIQRTPCKLGGSRAWFLCPASGCGQRVAILYSAGVFACRRCCDLAYASTREDAGDRAIRRAERIRTTLGWRPGVANGHEFRPRHMRWRTFLRLIEQHDLLVEVSVREIAQQFGLGRKAST